MQQFINKPATNKNLCCYTVLLILSFCLMANSRKSDYKRVIFSDYVNKTFEKNFQQALDGLEEGSEEMKLYHEYLRDHTNATVNRIQPSKKVGGKQNITIEGNRKKWLVLETLSKRRPLLFQADDFLFDDECENIKNAAVKLGLGASKTFGPSVDAMYDNIGDVMFEEVDLDNDTLINSTELAIIFVALFDNRLGNLLIRDVMKKAMMDFNLDGAVEPWEWNAKNLTRLVMLLNETQSENPSGKIRFSEQQWLSQTDSNSTMLRSIQDRLHKLSGLPLPMIRNSEYLQVVKYQPGGHYDCHHDSDQAYYSDNFKPCCHIAHVNDDLDCGVCRYMTVLYYLDDTEAGGQTAFPVAGVDPYKNDIGVENAAYLDWCSLSMHCQKSKIRVTPKKGRAVLWYNHFINPDTEWIGALDRNSLHGGCAVHRGTKWIANNWINVGHYKQHDILQWAINEAQMKKGKEEEATPNEKSSSETTRKDSEVNSDVNDDPGTTNRNEGNNNSNEENSSPETTDKNEDNSNGNAFLEASPSNDEL